MTEREGPAITATPTKNSLTFFKARRDRWKNAPRSQLLAMPSSPLIQVASTAATSSPSIEAVSSSKSTSASSLSVVSRPIVLSSAYPPISSKAPTPFGSTVSEKPSTINNSSSNVSRSPVVSASRISNNGGSGFTFGATSSSGSTFSFGTSDSTANSFSFGKQTTSSEKELESPKKPDEPVSATGKTAARVFDEFDKSKQGSLPISSFEDLSDELGEGFHGDEYDKQISLIDPSDLGNITRTAFIDWYMNLVEGEGDDGSSIDTEEREEREQERKKAKSAFKALAKPQNGALVLSVSAFGKLIECMGTVYCEVEHRKTLKKLKKSGDVIHESDFLSWYVDWLFGGDESTDEEDDDSDMEEDTDALKIEYSPKEGLNSLFKIDKDSWKCEVCSVRNNGDAKKCAACETLRPGFGDEVANADKKNTASGSAIGSTGFSFGGGSTTSKVIGSGGFTFGAAPSPVPATDETKANVGFTFGATNSSGNGFSFGSKATDVKTKSSGSSSGFTFGATSNNAESAPYFRAKPASKASVTIGESHTATKTLSPAGATRVKSESKAPAAISSYPPMSAKAPTPFGGGSKPAATKSSNPFSGISLVPPKTQAPVSSSSYLPISSTVRTPFGATNSKSDSKAPAASSSNPPMSAKAPTPFGGGSKPAATKSSNPFSGISLVPPKTPAPVSSSSYPPMSSMTPTPFSFKFSTTTPVATTALSSYPPPYTNDPTPFGAAKPSIVPMSSKSPTPFGTPQAGSSTSNSPIALNTSATSDLLPKSNNSATDNGGSTDYRSRLIEFYKKHNPDKVDTVDATLNKYKSKEEELFRKLDAKYNKGTANGSNTSEFPLPSGHGPMCYVEFSVDGEVVKNDNGGEGRLVIKLYKDKAPLACENFRCLCTGEITRKRRLCYLGSKVHRIVPNLCVQMGDFTRGDGRGGQSIYPRNSKEYGTDGWGKFKDEVFLQHSKAGLLSMANSGKDSNSSQVFFTLKQVPHLDGKHVVFGEIVEGMDVLKALGKLDTNKKTQAPLQLVTVSGSGEIVNGKDSPCLPEETEGSDKSPFAFSGAPSSSPFSSGSTTSPFGFGSSSSTNTSNSIFGSTGAASPFTFGATTSSSTSAPAFGSTASSSSSTSFGLGGTQSSTGSFPSSSPSPFAFGSSSTTVSTPFRFSAGTSDSSKTPTFSFGDSAKK